VTAALFVHYWVCQISNKEATYLLTTNSTAFVRAFNVQKSSLSYADIIVMRGSLQRILGKNLAQVKLRTDGTY